MEMQNKGATGTSTQSEIKTLIAERLNKGKQKMEVVDELVHSGMTHQESMQIVEQIYYELKKTVREEEFSGDVLVPALLGGLIAAVIGGAVWGGIVIWTGYEIGYVAWGVGLLCGMGVVMLSQGKRGMPLQLIAVVSSVLGILIGKYMAFFDAVKAVVIQDQGAEAAEAMSMFSLGGIQFFAENITSLASGFDALWMVLAVYTAWSIPKASGLKI
jgi:hypothetical protein